jgi:hypothetical protein
MTFRIYLIIISASILGILSCQKFEPEIYPNLPDSVALGKSLIAFNGELVDYKPTFKIPSPLNDVLELRFTYQNHYIFDWIELDTGRVDNPFEFSISSDNQPFNYEKVGFNYLDITALNQSTRTVEGRFYVKFERVSTGHITTQNNLPTILLYQGVFHENY